MIFKKDNITKPDYLQDWPTNYYEIETAAEKRAVLETALANHLNPPYDTYRMKLLEKRYFSHDKNGNVDAFMYAWTMIKASSSSGVSFFTKKKQLRELLSYMQDLCLIHYEPECPEEKQVLTEEWASFAAQIISSNAGNRTYCSTLWGLIPMKDTLVAQKIADDIELVTQKYPSQFGYEEAFAPFHRILKDTFCQMIENGSSYFEI